MPLGIPKVRNPYYNPHPDENKDGTYYSDPEAPSPPARRKLPYTEPDPLYSPERRRPPSTEPDPYYPPEIRPPSTEPDPKSPYDPPYNPKSPSHPLRPPDRDPEPSYPDPERRPNRKSELGTGPFPVQNSGLPQLPGFAANPPNLVLNPETQWVDI